MSDTNDNNERYRCETAVQLRFNDLDLLGHVNNSVYMQLLDLGKTDYFTRVRHGQLTWREVPVMTVNINCDFMRQTYGDEPVSVLTRVSRIGDKSLVVDQQVINSDTREVKCRCATTMVYIDIAAKAPATVPQSWRDDIAAFESHESPLAP